MRCRTSRARTYPQCGIDDSEGRGACCAGSGLRRVGAVGRQRPLPLWKGKVQWGAHRLFTWRSERCKMQHHFSRRNFSGAMS
jgi:hypothetical protein